MNELTIEEFGALSPGPYVLYDIRSSGDQPRCHQRPLPVLRKNWRKSAGKGEKAHHLLQSRTREP